VLEMRPHVAVMRERQRKKSAKSGHRRFTIR
jgi:hypothetical protein